MSIHHAPIAGAKVQVDPDYTAAHDLGGESLVTPDQRAALDANTTLSGTNPVASMADVGSSPYAGTTPDAPVALAPVDYLLSTLNGDTPPAATYDDAAGTLTETDPTDGVLSADGHAPTVGQRILWYYNNSSDQNGVAHGIYVVTNPGNGTDTPWVLTRAADCDSIAKRCRYWGVGILSGTKFAAGSARVTVFDAGGGWFDASLAASGNVSTASGNYSSAWGNGSSASGNGSTAWGNGSTAAGNGSSAAGNYSSAAGNYSSAAGNYSSAAGNYSSAAGNGSTASGNYSSAAGNGSTASGNYSSAAGNGSTASGNGSTAAGNYSSASSDGQVADAACPQNGSSGLGQHSRIALTRGTTEDVPATLSNSGNSSGFTFCDTDQVADYTRTAVIKGTVVARESDTLGTDSAWSFAGVIRGDGSTAYSWVGGSAPSPTVIAQDAGASAWAVAVTISGATIVVTATGAVATSINWVCDLEVVEIASPGGPS
jgi:hypothetical protein